MGLTKHAKKQLINFAFLAVLIGTTLLVLFLSQDFNLKDMGAFLSDADVCMIAAAVACMLLFILFEGLSLHVVARRLGHRSKFASSVAYSASDIYYSAITPSASGGQPASMLYMMRDGMNGGIAGFTLIFNLIAYTGSIIVIGLFAFIARPEMFAYIDKGFAKTLIILGFAVQALLLGLLIMCMLWSRAVRKLGHGAVSLLAKMHIIKDREKWHGKVDGAVDKYRASKQIIKQHPMLFLEALGLNLVQRVAQTLIPSFVCCAVDKNASFFDIYCMQSYVILGYNSIPLPGGTGAYEYLYLSIYGAYFPKTFILSAMMVSRIISYYFCMIVSGVYTLVYHVVGGRKPKPEAAAIAEKTESADILAFIENAQAAVVGEPSISPEISAVDSAEQERDDTAENNRAAPPDYDRQNDCGADVVTDDDINDLTGEER